MSASGRVALAPAGPDRLMITITRRSPRVFTVDYGEAAELAAELLAAIAERERQADALEVAR